jgi:peptidyl-prolyl cis-trans isomerase C
VRAVSKSPWTALRRAAREPSLRFLLIAVLIYAADAAWRGPPPPRAARPSLDEEALVREARALGLDREDPIVRRRLIQKMDLLLDALSEPGPLDDDALGAHLAAHPGRFRREARLELEQVFVDRGRHGADTAARAEALGAALRDGRPASGDPHPHGRRLGPATRTAIASRLGPALATAADQAPLRSWTGPIESPWGLHWIRVAAREEARSASLAEARAEIEADLRADRRARAKQRRLAELRRRHGLDDEPRPRPESGATVARGPTP